MPQTPAVRKRRFVVSFHVDENELSFLNRQVAASSLNREEYLRTLIVGKESPDIASTLPKLWKKRLAWDAEQRTRPHHRGEER